MFTGRIQDIGRWTFGYWILIRTFAFDTVKVQAIRHSTTKKRGSFREWPVNLSAGKQQYVVTSISRRAASYLYDIFCTKLIDAFDTYVYLSYDYA